MLPLVAACASPAHGDFPRARSGAAAPSDRCAQTSVDLPAVPAPCAAPGAKLLGDEVTLAPGGVARAHVTWRARKLAWPTVVEHVGCCTPVANRPPLDAGPLAPGEYRLLFFAPVNEGDSQNAYPHDEATVEVVP